MLLKYKKSEADLFSRPFVGYENIDILSTALENWEQERPEQVLLFLSGEGDYQPLLRAAQLGNVDMMKFLISKEAYEKQRG